MTFAGVNLIQCPNLRLFVNGCQPDVFTNSEGDVLNCADNAVRV